MQPQLSEFKVKLRQSASVNSDLKEHLEAKEEVLQSKNEEKEQLQTAIDALTKTMDSVKQTVKQLCGQIRDVSTCKTEAVTLHSLKYHKQSGTSNLGQTATFRLNVLLPSSWSHLGMVMSLVYMCMVLLSF